jgi:hypothetical protein
VTGGYRYRGTANPALQGLYFYADYCSGKIWRAIQSGASWGSIEAVDSGQNVSAFGEDEAGELYVVALGGSIFKIAQAGSQPAADCSARPRVLLQTSHPSSGTLSVTVSATDSATVTGNALQSIAFNNLVNVTVTAGSQVNQQNPFTVSLPAGTRSTSVTLHRIQAGQSMRVDFGVTDRCGLWQTFVGAGVALT